MSEARNFVRSKRREKKKIKERREKKRTINDKKRGRFVVTIIRVKKKRKINFSKINRVKIFSV